MKKVDLVVDMQFGSTGKGLIAGYLAEKNGYDTVINANMPNAGHTYINSDGREWMHKVLPNGIVSPNLKRVMLGAGSVFDPKVLMKEIDASWDILEDVEILIHPMAGIVTDEHRAAEAVLESIGSTKQGSMACLVEKMERNPSKVVVARDVLADPDHPLFYYPNVRVAEHGEWKHALKTADSILAEGAQGYSLGLSQPFYPYTTSRDCTPARFFADMGIPLPYMRHVVGVARCHPIRVGGTSGECYPDSVELTWEELGQEKELTTVTKKVRRVFTFSDLQLEDAMFEIQPDMVFLNFCNYLEDAGWNDVKNRIEMAADESINLATQTEVDGIDHFMGRVHYLGFGPKQSDVKEVF